jgi:holliday junction DNA helicase RuvA
MIAYLDGKIAFKDTTFAIIDINGVGYQVRISIPTSTAIGDNKTFKLYTYLQVREDAHTLFGFADLAEKNLFLDLTSVSGVGSNTAIVILSAMTIYEIRQAIASDNYKLLQNVKGIGLKTAQRIVLELKDKIKREGVGGNSTTITQDAPTSHTAKMLNAKNEALSALVALGVARATAEKNIETVIKKLGADLSAEELIKQALRTT